MKKLMVFAAVLALTLVGNVAMADYVDNANRGDRYIEIGNTGGDIWQAYGGMRLKTYVGEASYQEVVRIKGINGAVGIGYSDEVASVWPTKLAVNGPIAINTANAYPGAALDIATGMIKLGNNQNVTWGDTWSFISGYSGEAYGPGGTTYHTSYFRIMTGDTERLRVIDNGDVGIGTPTPAAKLDVIGEVYADDIRVGADDNADSVPDISLVDIAARVATLEATPPEADLEARLIAIERALGQPGASGSAKWGR